MTTKEGGGFLSAVGGEFVAIGGGSISFTASFFATTEAVVVGVGSCMSNSISLSFCNCKSFLVELVAATSSLDSVTIVHYPYVIGCKLQLKYWQYVRISRRFLEVDEIDLLSCHQRTVFIYESVSRVSFRGGRTGVRVGIFWQSGFSSKAGANTKSATLQSVRQGEDVKIVPLLSATRYM